MSEVSTANGSALMSFIERAARDPDFDVNKFALLLDKQQEMQRERARQEFNTAMSAVMADIGPVIRDKLNPAVNRKYATLEAIDAVARPEYSRHGFAVRFGCDKPPKDGWMRITCTVSHSGGYSEQNYLDSPVDLQQGARARTPVQAVGSTITYLRRYLLQMAFNIVLADDETDDDGMRAAAAPVQRAARVAERAPAYEAPPEPPRTRTRRDFLDGLAIALRDAQNAEEVDRILCAEEVMRAKEVFKNGHKEELNKLIAAALAKWWTEPPAAEELGEVEIEGERNVMAGD